MSKILKRWTGEVVGTMHLHGISVKELAHKMGVRREYLSQILNCKKEPEGAEFRVWTSLLELVKERQDAETESIGAATGQGEITDTGTKGGNEEEEL